MSKYTQNYYEIIEKYKLFHKHGVKNQPGVSTFLGYALTRWVGKIKEIIDLTGSRSILDFGCGKAYLYNNNFKIKDQEYHGLSNFWDIDDIFLYDPGVEKYYKYPNRKYDGVICTDVIEHIPENDVINFIDNLFKLSNKFVFVVIATVPASKYFDDGTNIHLCLKSEAVWKDIFDNFKMKYPDIDQHVYFND